MKRLEKDGEPKQTIIFSFICGGVENAQPALIAAIHLRGAQGRPINQIKCLPSMGTAVQRGLHEPAQPQVNNALMSYYPVIFIRVVQCNLANVAQS